MSESLPNKTTILIVGAGPAGLAAALSLLHHGVQDLLIVDAVPQGRNTSRAIVVHAATLEALDTIDCGEDITSQGTKSTTLSIGNRSKVLFSPDIESLKSYTRHPYIVVIPQNLTERVLEKKLTSHGVVVRRPLKVVGLKRSSSDPHFTDVTFEDGTVVTTKYIIGADGSHSTVRTLAGINFSNLTRKEGNSRAQILLADVTFDTTGGDATATSGITFSRDSRFLCVTLPSTFNESLAAENKVSISDRIYRIGCAVPVVEGEIPHSPSKEYLQDLVDRFGPHRLSSDPAVNPNLKPTCIKNVVSSSRFRIHVAIADTTFTRLDSGEGGAVLLIGDAAHVHSPAGGQGMNLSMRDAIFLGEALTKHIHASETKPPSEADGILRKFADVRRARALEVIKFTERIQLFRDATLSDRVAWWCPFDSATVGTWVLWVLGCLPFVRRRIAWELSGLSRR